MTALLNLAAHARIGRLAVVAVALAIGIVALGVPAAAEAAGAGQATADFYGDCERRAYLIYGIWAWFDPWVMDHFCGH